jgi:hypothetical protein
MFLVVFSASLDGYEGNIKVEMLSEGGLFGESEQEPE